MSGVFLLQTVNVVIFFIRDYLTVPNSKGVSACHTNLTAMFIFTIVNKHNDYKPRFVYNYVIIVRCVHDVHVLTLSN